MLLALFCMPGVSSQPKRGTDEPKADAGTPPHTQRSRSSVVHRLVASAIAELFASSASPCESRRHPSSFGHDDEARRTPPPRHRFATARGPGGLVEY